MAAAPLVLMTTFADDHQGLFFDDAAHDRMLDLGRGSWSDSWDEVRARFGPWDRDPRTIAKRSTAPADDGVTVLCVRDEIRAHAERILGPFGEFLPVITNDGPVWAFHCLNEVDALDVEASDIPAWASDPTGPDPRILFANRLAFDEDKAAKAKVFALKQEHGRGVIYYTRPVVEALLDPPGLFTGTVFVPAS